MSLTRIVVHKDVHRLPFAKCITRVTDVATVCTLGDENAA